MPHDCGLKLGRHDERVGVVHCADLSVRGGRERILPDGAIAATIAPVAGHFTEGPSPLAPAGGHLVPKRPGLALQRVNAGLARARANGTKLGRRRVEPAIEARILELKGKGKSMLKIGRQASRLVSFSKINGRLRAPRRLLL